MLRIFICHASADDHVVKRLVERLLQVGYDVWHDGREARVGTPIRQEIERRLDEADIVVAVLSPDATTSRWVQTELDVAITRWHDRSRPKVLPVVVADCEVPTMIAHLQRADLRRDFESGVAQLIESLKGVGAKQVAASSGTLVGLGEAVENRETQSGLATTREYSRRRDSRRRSGMNTPRAAVAGQLGCGVRDFNEDKDTYRSRLSKALVGHSFRVPSKYLYQLEGGWEAWLKMCELQEYTYYRNSLAGLRRFAAKIVEEAIRTTGDREFDYLSLGCGDGTKDIMLLGEMAFRLDDMESLYYYPVDISDTLISKAAGQLLRNRGLSSKVEVFFIEGDICSLLSYRPYYEYFAGNNFFSILGNTIGNNNEGEMFEAIAAAMLLDDIILFEVNTDREGAREQRTLAGDRGKNWERHTLPLRALGASVNREQVLYRVYDPRKNKNIRSIVPETVTVEALCKSFELDGQRSENVVLSSVHHYGLDQFTAEAEVRMGLTKIWSDEYDGVGFLLAKKTRSPFDL